MTAADTDHSTRLAAFDWLSKQVEIHGDVLPWSLLLHGFTFRGSRVPLLSQQGIFKPRVMELPLSMRTSLSGPYDDSFGSDGLLEYRYRGTDPRHRDNVGLRQAMERQVPLAYFHGVFKGKYLAVWPVYIVADDPGALAFSVAVDDAELSLSLVDQHSARDGIRDYDDSSSRRQYVTSLVRRRLHQRTFRERVLKAYREQCALCRLKHAELLDAAHIIPDSEERGEPRVPNGLSLCKLHHAAFDSYFLAVRPDYKIEVRADILLEHDGPMLRHGLQEVHGTRIVLPRSTEMRPDPELLDERYERFRSAGV